MILLTRPHYPFIDQIVCKKVYEGEPIPKDDLCIVVGAPILPKKIIQQFDMIVNFHGGDPEKYRGSDSHLWAIYHKDYNFIATLHNLTEELDGGDIILQQKIPVLPNMTFEDLYKENFRVCVRLVSVAMLIYARYKSFPSRPQKEKGRYYRHIPEELKQMCVERFNEYTKGDKR